MGLRSMPEIPNVDVKSQTPAKSPQFYGCYDSSRKTILYLPNSQWIPTGQMQANQSTMTQKYSATETDYMIENARQNVNQGGDKEWPLCVACAMMKNFQHFTGSLKNKCQSCFQKYCYNPSGT